MKTIIITDFEQGENTKRTKTGYISAFSTDSVTFEISAEKATQFALLGYDEAKNELFSLDWYDTGKTLNLLDSSYNNARYWRLSIRYKDNSEIAPSDLENLTITVKNYWYIDENGGLRFDGMPYAPEKHLTKPYPSALWRVDGDIPTHEVYPKIPENAVKSPFPLALWRAGDLPYHELMPPEIPAGAFMGAKSLEYVRIPENVRKIGKYAFADTALKSVRISPECEYFETSFPENCVVEFYGRLYIGKFGQLCDCNNSILTDYDGARIYTQEI